MPSSGAIKVTGEGLKLGLNFSGTFEPGLSMFAGDIMKLGMDIRSFHEPLKRAIQQVMAPSFVENFNSGGRPEPWEPWADITPVLREQLWGLSGGSLLVKTGLLRRTMGQLNIWQINNDSATLNELPQKVWYGVLQNDGYGNYGAAIKKVINRTPALKKMMKTTPKMAREKAMEIVDKRVMSGDAIATNIPARPFVMFQDQDLDAVRDVFARWFDERVNAHLAGGKVLAFGR